MDKVMEASTGKYRYLLILMMVQLLALAGCDIHEYPAVPPTAKHEVSLVFNVESMFSWGDMTEWEYDQTKAGVPEGRMRYVIRLYPSSEKGRSSSVRHVQEHIVYADVKDMYGSTFTLDLLPGEYDMKVWADLEIPGSKGEFYHDISDFAEISLIRHEGNSHHRDAFRGSQKITVYSGMHEREPEPIVVRMERPLAKFEIITDDLEEFVTKQLGMLSKNNAAGETKDGSGDTKDGTDTKSIDLDNYKVVIAYPGFMPSAYNMFIDKPVDSMAGVSFGSVMTQLNSREAHMGFDHVFVNGKESAVTVQVGLYDLEGTQLALTNPIDIPLQRNRVTVVKGSFLLQHASGGVGISPGYDGEYNYEIKW